MFQIKQNPTFDANITFTGQGREQTLAVTFKAKPRRRAGGRPRRPV